MSDHRALATRARAAADDLIQDFDELSDDGFVSVLHSTVALLRDLANAVEGDFYSIRALEHDLYTTKEASNVALD